MVSCIFPTNSRTQMCPFFHPYMGIPQMGDPKSPWLISWLDDLGVALWNQETSAYLGYGWHFHDPREDDKKWKFWKGEFCQEETSFVAPEWGAQPLELEFYRASQVISGPWGPQPPTASAQRPERLTPGGELKIWEDKPPSAQGDISGVALLGETEVASCGCYRWSTLW